MTPHNHRPVTTKTAGLKGTYHFSIHGVPSEGYGARPDVETMYVNTEHSFEVTDQYYHLYHLTVHPWKGPPSHSVTATLLLAAVPPGTIPWDLHYPQRLGIWDRSGHPGGTDWKL